MANFLAIVDADDERRQWFVRRVRDEIAPLDSLRIANIEAGHFAAVWAAQDRAPISSTRSSAEAAIIWGDAIPGPGWERLDAAGLLRAWAPCVDRPPAPFDGFYAAVRYDQVSGLTAGADVLGLFPVYYAASGTTLIVSSSPELFRCHPCFPATLSLTGLTGLLLTHAILDGRALLAGIRRLRPGHVLTWREHGAPLEITQYTIPVSPLAEGDTFPADVAQLDAAFAKAVDRHVPPDGSTGILLSGGRDSRQLAGYVRERGVRLHALTLGSATDYDVRCARAVARALACTHRVMDVDEAAFVAGAIRQARWEHLGSGFSSIHSWAAIAPLRELPPRFVSGYIREICEVEANRFVVDEPLRGGWMPPGLDADTLRRLLRREVFGDEVERTGHRLRELYTGSCAVEDQRPWRFFLAHDARCHAGGIPWRLSFGSWPVLPILDRAVLEVLSVLPQSSLANRRAQDEILRRRFPELARLPLDRGTDDTLPILPSATQKIRHRVWQFVEPIRRRVPRTVERRYYHRVYDINSAGWRAIRRLAEPHRERLAHLVDMDVLAELVPPPDAHIAVKNVVSETYGIKMLIGLMLWAADHLA
jgi:asparagine synthase (glutamine-hydrolysing)